MGDRINEGFLQENVWQFCNAPKKIMAVLTRWQSYKVAVLGKVPLYLCLRCHGHDVATLISDIFFILQPCIQSQIWATATGWVIRIIDYRVCSHCKTQTTHRLKTTGP